MEKDIRDEDPRRNLKAKYSHDKKETVLTQEEADARSIQYKPWYKCRAGEWGLTDDRYVILTKSRSDFGDRSVFRYYGLNSKGYIPGRPDQNFRYGDSYQQGYHWIREELRKRRTKDVIKTYVQMLITGTIDWDVLGNMYRPDQAIPRATVKRLFKQEKVKEVIREEVSKALSKKGITEESVLDMYIEAHGVAKTKADAASMIRVAEDLTDILEMKPSRESKTFEFGITQDLSQLVMSEEKKVERLQDKPANFEDLGVDETRSAE